MTTVRSLLSADEDADVEWTAFVAGDCVYSGDGQSLVGGDLQRRVAGADAAVVNLEAPVETDLSPAAKSGPAMDLDGDTPRVLAEAGVDGVTLANNHLMDYGSEAMAATRAACADAGLQSAGAGPDRAAAHEPALFSVDGDRTLAVVSVCEQEFGVATADAPGVAWVGDPGVEDRVAAAADAHDGVVVAEHGGVEEVPFSPPERRDRLRSLARAGADAVVGHHPHVPQGYEVVDGVPVLHSAGNFYFPMTNDLTRWGVGVELGFAGGELARAALVPLELVDGTVREMGVERNPERCLRHLDDLAEVLADDETYRAHWQETAERVFLSRYGHSLRKSTGGTLLSLLRNPLAYVRQDGMWDGSDRRESMLVLLNLVRNESHSAAIETALALRAGDVEDVRTPRTRERTREFLSWTAEDSLYDQPHRAQELFAALVEKISA